jgi:hypothetical protein
MGSALKREFKVGDEVCHTNKFSTGIPKVLWNTSSVPCYHASHALLLLKEREDAIEEASKLIAN